jgi:hypothetical protein
MLKKEKRFAEENLPVGLAVRLCAQQLSYFLNMFQA